jgi:hypothetical protein
MGTYVEPDPKQSKTIIGVPIDILYKYLAPLAQVTTATSDIIKFKNLDTGETLLLERKQLEQQERSFNPSPDEFGEYDMPYDGDYNYDYGEDFIEGDYGVYDGGYDSDETYVEEEHINLGDYQLFNGDGVLTRFNPPSLHITNLTEHIIDSYNYNGEIITNIIISEGKVKQFEYNEKVYDITSNTSIIQIVKSPNKPDIYNIDQVKLNSIINRKINCE